MFTVETGTLVWSILGAMAGYLAGRWVGMRLFR